MGAVAAAGYVSMIIALMSQRKAYAAAVPGAEIDVVRSSAAATCPDAEVTAEKLRARIPRSRERSEPAEPLKLRVRIDADETEFFAIVRVSGRSEGVRTLVAEGPGCEALEDALVLSLLLLLDVEPFADAPPAPAAPHRPEAATPPPAQPEAKAQPTPFAPWIGAGIAVTQGLPYALGVAPFVGVWLRNEIWEFNLSGLWSPERRIAFGPGDVLVQAIGLQAGGCIALLRPRELRVNGCAIGEGIDLRGRAIGFTDATVRHRPWWLAGAAAELRWFPKPSVGLGISADLLVSFHSGSFSIDHLGPGPAYETDRVLGRLAASAQVKIW